MSELAYTTIILQMTFRAGTALLLATLGEIYAERSGILNLGIEGMMSMGAISGFIVAHLTGNPWLGLLVAALVGGIFSIVHAFAALSAFLNLTSRKTAIIVPFLSDNIFLEVRVSEGMVNSPLLAGGGCRACGP